MAIIWELDFYSRPILDENNKKLWEVLICETPQSIDVSLDSLYRYTEFCPSNTVNSIRLGEAIKKAMEESGQNPSKIRFFRRPMKNMITKACDDLQITPAPSRRTYTLNHWIKQRLESYYPTLTGYDPQSINTGSVEYPDMNAIPLPDAIRGDKGDRWALVSLPAKDFQDMTEWDIAFGEAFPLSLFNLSPDTPIPGLIIFSNRALPFGGWLSGLELGFISLEATTPSRREMLKQFNRLRLETGISDSWILLDLVDEASIIEAQNFTNSKANAANIHFLAVQSTPESQSFAGFWLLQG